MNHQTDEQVVQEVLADRKATTREKELAKRLLKHIHSMDIADEILSGLRSERGVLH